MDLRSEAHEMIIQPSILVSPIITCVHGQIS